MIVVVFKLLVNSPLALLILSQPPINKQEEWFCFVEGKRPNKSSNKQISIAVLFLRKHEIL